MQEVIGPPQGHVVVPVPVRGRRLRQTGFDPVGLMAFWLARDHGWQVARVLRRRGALPQKALDFAGRSANIRGRISFRRVSHSLIGRRVVLVDDVFTTGATLDECARVLRLHGVDQVRACTLLMEE